MTTHTYAKLRTTSAEKHKMIRRYVNQVGLDSFHVMPIELMYQRFLAYLHVRKIDLDVSKETFKRYIGTHYPVETSYMPRLFNRRVALFVLSKKETYRMQQQKRKGFTISYIFYLGLDGFKNKTVNEMYGKYEKAFKDRYTQCKFQKKTFVSYVLDLLPLEIEHTSIGFIFVKK